MRDPSGRFSLRLPGEVEVQERSKERNDRDYYDTVSLAKEDRDYIELNVHLNYDEEEEPDPDTVCEIGLHEVHIENKETGRAFHVAVNMRLRRSDVENLHAYLGFLLSLK